MRTRGLKDRFVVLAVLLTTALAGAGRSLAAESTTLAEKIGRLVTSPDVGQMRVGIEVVYLQDRPQVVYAHDHTEPFKPASNQKILTTAAALTLLPADFKFRTILARRGADLVVIGSGDPSMGDPRMAEAAGEPITAVFRDWAEKLKEAGVTRIEGDLLFDDFIFEQQHIHPSWNEQFKDEMQNWYMAPVGGLNFNDNCVDVVVRPGGKAGEPAEVTLIPNTPYVQLDNSAKTASKGQPIILRSASEPMTVKVSGAVSRPSDASNPLSLAVGDPGEFFASTLRTVLAAKGIAIAGETRRAQVRQADGSLPKDLTVVAVHEQPLTNLLWRCNKSSMNLFAEALLKTLAAHADAGETPRTGSWETGREVLTGFLQGIGIPLTGVVIDDGSGLSHTNRVTPAVLVTVLTYMDRHPRREEWIVNLAVPGEKEGTLRNRMKDLAGRIFAKTGHIGGVSSLSGYALGPQHRRYAFSILCNDTNKAKKLSAHALQDSVCRLLATWEGPITSSSAE